MSSREYAIIFFFMGLVLVSNRMDNVLLGFELIWWMEEEFLVLQTQFVLLINISNIKKEVLHTNWYTKLFLKLVTTTIKICNIVLYGIFFETCHYSYLIALRLLFVERSEAPHFLYFVDNIFLREKYCILYFIMMMTSLLYVLKRIDL